MFNRRQQRPGYGGYGPPQQEPDTMQQIMQMYQMFSPEAKAKEALLQAQAAQLAQETEFGQQSMDSRLALLSGQGAHQQAQVEAMRQATSFGAQDHPLEIAHKQLQMDAARQAMDFGVQDHPLEIAYKQAQTEALRAQTLQMGAPKPGHGLDEAQQLAQIVALPHDQQYALFMASSPEVQAKIKTVAPKASMSPKELQEFQLSIGGVLGPAQPGVAPPPPVDRPVDAGRKLFDMMQAKPELAQIPLDENQKMYLELYKQYQGLPSWIDQGHSTLLQQAQGVKNQIQMDALLRQLQEYYSPTGVPLTPLGATLNSTPDVFQGAFGGY